MKAPRDKGRVALVFAAILAGVLLAVPAAALVTGQTALVGGKNDPAQSSATKSASSAYIVQLLDAPAVAYEGGIAGYKATAPTKGNKINPLDNDVVKYVGYLASKHDAAAAKAGAQKLYDYAYSFNGFAAKLSPGQVAKLQADSGVVSVEKTQEVSLDTATTPTFLGLTDATNGLWTKGIKGEGVIIGILDTGVWPESLSFTDRTGTNGNASKDGKLDYHQIPGWNGKCTPGEDFNASMCNQKLIGAQYFCAARPCDTGVLPHEFVSARDFNGHGTHTASTAGGNQNVPTTGAAALFGHVNGIAPRARISAYKIGWDNGAGGAGANTGDVVAAIDQAVADGVDVLNYSFSGTQTSYGDAVEIAFLFASEQGGVFVATSAGNSGPTASTVAHISPWLASVAAGTHNRSGSSTVTLGNGAVYTGASLTPGVGPAPLVYAGNVKLPAAPLLDATLCFPGTLDSAQVTGKIVLCDRGVNARVEKSAVVKAAGGVGMILRNVSPNSLNADLHSIPTVHVDNIAGPAIKTYIDTAGAAATATLAQATVNNAAPAPDVASFSSRGPSTAGGGDILKPDFMAPGQDILAAVAPPGNAGKDFDLYSGTSMSSPHIAGIGALLTQAHPDWSSAALRSAIATTADATSRAGLNLPFNTGSGHVRPNLAVDPGLVYDAGFDNYRAFLRSQGLCTFCFGSSPAAVIDPSDLNQPSLAIGDLAGSQTLTRTVTNVGSAGTYTATVAAPSGYNVTVAPSSFAIAAGGTQTFTVAIERTSAPLGTYRFGSLTWSDGTHSVRSPIVVRPVAIAAPPEIAGTATSGSTAFSIKTGYVGSLSYPKVGLTPATTEQRTVADDPVSSFNTGNPDGNQGIQVHDLVVPAGTAYARVQLFDEFTDGEDDLDLYVYRVNPDLSKTLVGASGGGTAAEQVNLANPIAATYKVYVHGWETDGPDAVYTLFSWVLNSDVGNMTVTGPSTAGIGTVGSVSVGWTGLTAGQKYLGAILYNDGVATIGRTIVRINS